ncbi:MAG: hypothetical protein ING90_16885 [Rhodocyclaceae bacterium]|nr:hypothetical protein [Rhodocyclaceae bacterium]MCA3088970.1 hypothetical protein [Rhodocyclaceae bacterium]MCA3095706.1 hypothetical protein [Rhodocyclaceae bacterium]MCA3097713.1 hypothetical protein [Rhodocyclaceae bacterium]MCA3102887.1 hypothetical protein [Rhodocyclaceae bacterium]
MDFLQQRGHRAPRLFSNQAGGYRKTAVLKVTPCPRLDVAGMNTASKDFWPSIPDRIRLRIDQDRTQSVASPLSRLLIRKAQVGWLMAPQAYRVTGVSAARRRGMKAHDAFLRHLLGAVDRATVWTVLAVVLSAVTWTAAWERGLGLPALDGWRVLGLALLGRETDRTALTLLVLCALVGVMGASVAGGWPFGRWQRRAELDVMRLRGARWENDR